MSDDEEDAGVTPPEEEESDIDKLAHILETLTLRETQLLGKMVKKREIEAKKEEKELKKKITKKEEEKALFLFWYNKEKPPFSDRKDWYQWMKWNDPLFYGYKGGLYKKGEEKEEKEEEEK